MHDQTTVNRGVAPFLGALTLAAMLSGTIAGLLLVPADALQGQVQRLM